MDKDRRYGFTWKFESLTELLWFPGT